MYHILPSGIVYCKENLCFFHISSNLPLLVVRLRIPFRMWLLVWPLSNVHSDSGQKQGNPIWDSLAAEHEEEVAGIHRLSEEESPADRKSVPSSLPQPGVGSTWHGSRMDGVLWPDFRLTVALVRGIDTQTRTIGPLGTCSSVLGFCLFPPQESPTEKKPINSAYVLYRPAIEIFQSKEWTRRN